MTGPIEGILPVNKPAGMTSHDVVARARRLLGQRRIGHTGTLDPMATGVLPLVIGRATRLADLLQEMPKTYEAEMIFGLSTDTEDISGNVVEDMPEVRLDKERLVSLLAGFTGRIRQVPPMYSAVKKDGRRLYELAREGRVVEREAREVTIHELTLLDFDASGDKPVARLRVRCSKGTYIRTLCVDIGRQAGYPAVMSALVRTESGGITLAQTLTLDRLEQLAEEGKIAGAVLPMDRAIAHLPAVQLSGEEALRAANGRAFAANRVRLGQAAGKPGERSGGSEAESTDGTNAMNGTRDTNGTSGLIRVYGPDVFIGLFRLAEDGSKWVPYKVFAAKR